jgi:hypothetical protein
VSRPLGSRRRGQAGGCVHGAAPCDEDRLAQRTAGRRAPRGLTDRRCRAPSGTTLRGPHPALRCRSGRDAVLGRSRRCPHGARHGPRAVPDRKLIGTLEGGHSWTLLTPHAETPPAPAEAPEPPATPPRSTSRRRRPPRHRKTARRSVSAGRGARSRAVTPARRAGS